MDKSMRTLDGLREGGMTAFRDEYLEVRLGITDPHARFFLTPAMRRYAVAVGGADRRAIDRSLARFKRFGRRMASASRRISQFLVLGVGYDTRALWLPEIVAQNVRVIEVDLPDLIERKIRILGENGVRYPDRVVPIGMNLGDPALRQRLEAAGFDRSEPAALFVEGVLFHLPPEVSRNILDPRHLGLARGSEVTFDFWTKERVDRRNEAFGLASMQGVTLPESPAELEAALRDLGYRDIAIETVSGLAAALWPEEGHQGEDWRVVEANVA